MYLEMECKKCSVSKYCSKNGISPSFTKDGKRVLCRLVGGYGKKPLNPSILSPSSKEKADKNGYHLTIAEIPVIFNNDVFYEVEKIFSPPVRHGRETAVSLQEMVTIRNHKR